MWYLLFTILLLSLPWFFIGYWILKTGVNIYSAPYFFALSLKNNLTLPLSNAVTLPGLQLFSGNFKFLRVYALPVPRFIALFLLYFLR
jgi:hypothetical protein